MASANCFRQECDWLLLPHKLSKRQSLTTVLFRTSITQMIFFNQGILLLLAFTVCPHRLAIALTINDDLRRLNLLLDESVELVSIL